MSCECALLQHVHFELLFVIEALPELGTFDRAVSLYNKVHLYLCDVT